VGSAHKPMLAARLDAGAYLPLARRHLAIDTIIDLHKMETADHKNPPIAVRYGGDGRRNKTGWFLCSTCVRFCCSKFGII